MSALIVLVSSDPRTLRATDAVLSEAGHLVAAVSSSVEAQNLLDSVIPDLLVADLGSDAFNALHLALRSRLKRPTLPVIVTHAWAEPVAESEARDHGADFVVAPVSNPDFLRRVQAAVERHRRVQPVVRRWSRRPAPKSVLVDADAARARIVDVSYGGVRLAFDDERPIPPDFEITTRAGTTIKAHCAWTAPSSRNQFCCGAEIDEEARTDWRHFIDSFSQSPNHV